MAINSGNAQRQVAHNRRVHDRVARWYPMLHPEIYNCTEQLRLRGMLQNAVGAIRPATAAPMALDVGAGRGNLTNHLLAIGCRVTAADVSQVFLHGLLDDFLPFRDRLEVSLLNGRDLSQFGDGSFDLAACYSVLHHVPDYLELVREMRRVVRAGGVVMIDHEYSPSMWDHRPAYQEYRRQLADRYRTGLPLSTILSLPLGAWPYFLRRRVAALIGKMKDPRYYPEGDIHIHHDDHIDWESVVEALCGDDRAEVVWNESYLGCEELGYPAPVYERSKNQIDNLSGLIVRVR